MASGAGRAIDRRRDVAEAGHSGDGARARLHLGDRDPRVRSSALRALARADSLTAAELEAALGDPEPTARMAALELAAGRGDVPLAAIADRLADKDRRVVETAAWACGERVSTSGAAGVGQTAGADTAAAEAAGRLIDVAGRHEDPLCRESAIAALGAIGDAAGLAAVLAGLDDKPEVRRRAVIALAAFTGPGVEAALLRATADRDRQVRAAATELLGA